MSGFFIPIGAQETTHNKKGAWKVKQNRPPYHVEIGFIVGFFLATLMFAMGIFFYRLITTWL